MQLINRLMLSINGFIPLLNRSKPRLNRVTRRMKLLNCWIRSIHRLVQLIVQLLALVGINCWYPAARILLLFSCGTNLNSGNLCPIGILLCESYHIPSNGIVRQLGKSKLVVVGTLWIMFVHVWSFLEILGINRLINYIKHVSSALSVNPLYPRCRQSSD